MLLARFENGGSTQWALVDEERTALRPIMDNFESWAARVTDGDGPAALRLADESLPIAAVRLLPPMERGPKIMVAGVNYRKHLSDFGLAAPTKPFIFMKPYGALIGANDIIRYSPLTNQLDFEIELVAVVGKPIDPAAPMKSVLGYTVGNDVSARDLQKGPPGVGMDLVAAKGLDKTCGLGPWIVTRDEFGDGMPDLAMTLWVNGEIRQSARTFEMTWDVGALLAYTDTRSALEPGDILFTGTPEGVAQGDGRFLGDGDIVEAEIEGLGRLRNVVRRPA